MNARNMTDAELVHAVDCDSMASEREKELAARFAEAYPYAHGDAAAEQLEALADRVAGWRRRCPAWGRTTWRTSRWQWWRQPAGTCGGWPMTCGRRPREGCWP